LRRFLSSHCSTTRSISFWKLSLTIFIFICSSLFGFFPPFLEPFLSAFTAFYWGCYTTIFY
jgi:hypothetical protein